MNTMQKKFSMSQHALAGATIACLVASLWVIEYLANTMYSLKSLLSMVLGQEHGIGADGAEALFVIGARFIIVFGFSWAPITALIAVFRRE